MYTSEYKRDWVGLSQKRDRILHPEEWASAVAYPLPSSQLFQCPGFARRSRDIHWAIPQEPCALREKQGTGTFPPSSALQEEWVPHLLLRHPSLPPHLLRSGLPGSEEGPRKGQSSSTLLLMPTEPTVATRTNLWPASLTEVG